MIDQLRKLDPDVLMDFRKKGSSSGIPVKLQSYIQHVDRAMEIYRFEGNISRAARQLQESFPHDDLSFNTARNRIYDAMNLFHLNNGVKTVAWDNFYADKMEDLAKLAIAGDNITEARRCFEKAHMFRTKAPEENLNPEDFKMEEFIVSPDVTHSRLNIPEHELKNVFKRGSKLINEQPIDTPEKEKMINELALATGQPIDSDYEDISDQ